MSPRNKHESLRVALALQVLTFFVPLEGVTVNPVRCPTNKIAPHRRAASSGNAGTRAYGAAFYDLLAPGPVGSGPYPQSTLQERPQEDDPNDCGDIEDYDETDLSSVSQPYYLRGNSENRFFFGGLFGNRPASGQRPPAPPAPPARPTKPPPYWSAGYFGSNSYRPPLQQEPSVHVKPVHEGDFESQSTYRPGIVGGPLAHIVGHSPVRPTTRPPDTTTRRRLNYHTRNPHRTEAPVYTARPRSSKPRAYNDGILGSFVDLLFK